MAAKDILEATAMGAAPVKCVTPQDVLEYMKEQKIVMVDFKLVDVPGQWQHITVPASEVELGTFTEGVAFDGSSVRGFQGIEASDMVMRPDPVSAVVDPFHTVPTLSLTCDVFTPDGVRYTRDPRFIAQKAEQYLRDTGIATTSLWGPELEFFILDSVRFDSGQHFSYYYIDSEEGIWNSGKEGSKGYPVKNKMGYFPVAPTDTQTDIRTEMVLELIRAGFRVERHHHEVATAGQAEINFGAATLTNCGDKVLLYKYILKNVAKRHGKTVTFMPKPLFADNGTGMHCHQSLSSNGTNLFWNAGRYGNLSELAMYYIGGILKHAPAILAFTNTTTNSYKRLVPGYEAPVNLVFSKGNRSAAVRIPISISNPKTARIEFRTPDCTANPYLGFAAMLLAGLDGINHKIDPVAAGYGPVDKNIYKLTGEEKAKVRSVPGSLAETLQTLRDDHEFLLAGGVFDQDFIENYIDLKTEEMNSISLRPHPMEFALYFDV